VILIRRKSTLQAIRDIVERGGLTGLYSGLNSSLLGIAITNGVYYFFYEGSKTSMLNRRPGSKALSTLESILAGLLAGTATTLLSNPIWVIQTSQAVRTMPDESQPIPKNMGFVQTAKHIVRKDGISGFWRGIYPALVLGTCPKPHCFHCADSNC
jgi:adenine nucleotide transporter 17